MVVDIVDNKEFIIHITSIDEKIKKKVTREFVKIDSAISWLTGPNVSLYPTKA